MREKFDEQLEQLNRELTQMGLLCENAIHTAASSMREGNHDKTKGIDEILAGITSKERDIESLCFRLLMQQQPVAGDLRLISSAIKMVTDLERIGVQSADICDIIRLDNIRSLPDRPHIDSMFDMVIRMVSDCVNSFVGRDENLARNVIQYDDRVDRAFDETKAELVEYLKEPEASGETLLDLLMIAKYLERIADHAVNIAKWVLFSITGVQEDVD